MKGIEKDLPNSAVPPIPNAAVPTAFGLPKIPQSRSDSANALPLAAVIATGSSSFSHTVPDRKLDSGLLDALYLFQLEYEGACP
jgi:hypothetical protein